MSLDDALAVHVSQMVALGSMSLDYSRAVFDPLEKAIRDISVPHDELIALAEAKAQAASEPL